MSVALRGSGHVEAVDVTATTKTLALTDCGTVQNINPSGTGAATCTVTLEATVVGTTHILRVGRENLTVNISPNASDKIAGNGFTATDDKDMIFTNQPAGSYVVLVADGVNGWMIQEMLGTATRQA